MNSRTPPPPPRNRPATEARIIAAVGTVLARDGFRKIGINAVAREAGVDKVLIYRYFDGLPALLRAWGESGEFWPTVEDLIESSPADLMARPLAERYARFLEHFIDSLRKRPLTIEILAGEIGERNALTEILETQREDWGNKISQILAGPDLLKAQPEIVPISILLIAGVQHLLVRARNLDQFGGIPIQTDAGWDQIKSALRSLAERMFTAPPQ